MRFFKSCRYLCGVLCIASLIPAGVSAQASQRQASGIPLSVTITLTRDRPALSVGQVLAQTAGGVIGGLGAALLTAAPFMMSNIDDDTAVLVMGSAYVAGTVIGIHYVGRRQDMRGHALATTAGVLVGAALGGATVRADEEGYAEPNLFIFVAPALGGAAGYGLTRRER